MAKSTILTLKQTNEWSNFIHRLPILQQDIYYTPEYYSLYERNGDGQAMCFVFESQGDVAIYPFLMNSINELGYSLDKEYFDIQGAYGYNGVLSSTYTSKFIDAFYISFNEYCAKNNIVAEFIRYNPVLKNQQFRCRDTTLLFDRKTVVVDLRNGKEDLWFGLQVTTRKQIKRCKARYNIEVKIKESGKEHFRDFLNIYNESMDRVNSSQFLRFNEDYFNNLFNINNLVQFIAFDGDNPIAYITAFVHGEYMHGHLGGTLNDYVKYSVFSSLYWEMIRFGLTKNLKYLHVGGGITNATDDALFNYKKHFSDQELDFYIGKRIYRPDIYSELLEQWNRMVPENIRTDNNKLLRYRDI